MERQNPDHSKPSLEEKELFSKLSIPYSQSKEEVWKGMQEQLQGKAATHRISTKKRISLWASRGIAAILLLAIGLSLFARFYTKSLSSPAGQLSTYELPDGSKADLHATASLSYHPFWWAIERKVILEGEAFFQVEHGSRFTVESKQGSTQVLGTEFNVYARDSLYQVYCKTGKVKVQASHLKSHVMLTKGMGTSSNIHLDQYQMNRKKEEEVLAWKSNRFLYNTTPMWKVISDLERHYGIEIKTQKKKLLKNNYTGLFSREVSAEEALQIISLSFGWKVEKSAEGAYLIK